MMDRKDRIIQTLASKLSYTEVLNAELLAIIQEMKEVEKENGDNQTAERLPTE